MASRQAERRLVNTLEAQITETDVSSSEVGEQREANHRFYSLQLMGNEQPGRSRYISPDVLDSVEGKKALFAETFLSGRKVIRFTPNGPGDEVEAEKRTAYVDQVFQRNKMHDLLRDAWHDAFVAKRCIFFCRWADATEIKEVQFENATQMQAIYQISQLNLQPLAMDDSGMQFNRQGGTASGTLEITVDDSHCEVILCQPERFYRDPNADYVWNSAYCSYEEDLTRAKLYERGFDVDQVDSLSTDYRWRSEEEDSSRKAHDQSWTRRRQHKRTEEQETVSFYTTFSWMSIDEHADALELDFEPEGVKLYKICWAHGEIMKYQDGGHAVHVASCMPFFEWTEYKIAHAEHGMADADLTRPTQKTQSILKRLIVDNQTMRNTTRYEAVYNAIKNPRDLLDTKIGGVIWSRALGSVAPLATPELSPLTLQVVEMLNQDGERRSGDTRLGKGLNPDAVSKQNSDNMIERLTNAGNRRVMRGARDFAQTCLVPMSNYIYRLGVQNETRTIKREIRGEYQDINPSCWDDVDQTVQVHSALTPQEAQKHAQTLMMMHQTLSLDPGLAPLYGLSQKHALLDEVFDALGVSDTSRYLARPDSPEVIQQLQQQAQQAQQERQKQEQLLQLQIDNVKAQENLGWERLDLDATDKLADNTREDEQLVWKIDKETQELELERTQRRPVAIA